MRCKTQKGRGVSRTCRDTALEREVRRKGLCLVLMEKTGVRGMTEPWGFVMRKNLCVQGNPVMSTTVYNKRPSLVLLSEGC